MFTTLTDGAEGVDFGAAVPDPTALVQPSTVWVTVYVPALLTVIDEEVSVVLHDKLPEADVDNVDVPLQLLVTLTDGAVGVVFGAAVPDPAALVQPSTVCVTVYVPALLTVIDEEVSVVLHNNVPEADVESVELPQLLVKITVGSAGIEFTVNVAAFEFTVPYIFVNTARY